MKAPKPLLFMIALTYFTVSCSSAGITVVGNPTSSLRDVTGTVSDSDTTSVSALFAHQNSDFPNPQQSPTESCLADLIVALNSSGEETEAEVSESCEFTLSLEPENAYEIEFFLEDEFVGRGSFETGQSSLKSRVFFLDSNESTLDLGAFTLNNFEAAPANEPYRFNDRDSDGIFDFDDDDDDDDGRRDEDEFDCDFDGFLDDLDDLFDDDFEIECEMPDDADGEILEVRPWHDERRIRPDEPVTIVTSCEVDESSVSDSTFSIVDEDGTPLSCEFEVEEDDGMVECEHEEDRFVSGMTYTATVSGLLCENGDEIEEIVWSWTSF